MRHDDGCAAVLLHLSSLGCMCARNFVGLVRTESGRSIRIGVPGHADISGRTSTGRAIAIEVKVGRDTLKPNQTQWAAAWQRGGGLYAVIRPDRSGWEGELQLLVS